MAIGVGGLQNQHSVYYEHINMGTYNYDCYTNPKNKHTLFDVDTYKKWGNTPEIPYKGEQAKKDNGDKFNKNSDAQSFRKSIEERIN